MRPRSRSTSTTRTADLVALVEHVLDGVDPLAGRHVGDVQEAVGALRELDKRAEGGRLDDLALERVADFDFLVIDRMRSIRASPCWPVWA
jgi:hypothetical protein